MNERGSQASCLTRKRRMMEFSERAFSTKNSELMTSSCKLVEDFELRYFTDFLMVSLKQNSSKKMVKNGVVHSVIRF